MKIDEQRRLVVPVVTDFVTKKIDDKEVVEEVVRLWAYHTPISREVFEQHFRVLAATKSALAGKGMHYLTQSGPRISALLLKDEGRKDAIARGFVDENGTVRDEETVSLLGELKRLTMILCPGPHGWDMLPVDTAISSGKIEAEDWEEVLAGIVFFTCNYAMARKANREATAKAYASFLDASITSSSPTEFVASLLNSTPVASTKTAPSSIPS
jgi:hypothetical protein